jgi:hypothetical protein
MPRTFASQFPPLPSFPPMAVEQASFLRARLREMTREQPALRVLRKRLLAIGGLELVAPVEPDPDLDKVLERSRPADGRNARRRRGLPSECHSNVAQLCRRSDGALRIATGYALSPDGLWRQHSWGVEPDDTLVETTQPRVLYFGFVLGGREARRFITLCG